MHEPTNQDIEHLRLLSIFHYVYAALTALLSCIPLIHLFLGVFMISTAGTTGTSTAPAGAPPEFVGWIFIIVAGVIIGSGWIFAALVVYAGVNLGRHRHRTYCLIIAALECLSVPLGTVLGVFTLIVLMRDPVRELFDRPEAVS